MAIINEVTEVLHKIEAWLYPNYLGKGEGAYIARAKAEAPLSIEDICASAKNRGGFTGQYEDLVEHVHIFVNELIYQLLDGFSAQIGDYFSLHTRLGGTYGERDHIDPAKISISFRELLKLKELLLKITVQNMGAAGDGVYIDDIIDIHTSSLNDVITPNGMLRVTGNKLKIDGGASSVGVYFVNQTDDSRVKVSENLALNRATELVVMIPTLTAGTWKLELVTQYSSGTVLLKEPRTIQAEPELTVT
jgi:hypothetical protein